MTRKTLTQLGLAALAAVIAAGAGVTYWLNVASQAGGYATIKVARGDIQKTVSALGVLVPSQYVDVGAQVSGQLIKLPVTLGDTVKQGQLVAEIDPTQYAAQVGQDKALIADLEAQLAGWQAKLALARWTNERNSRLAPQGGATGQALEQSKSDLKVAETTVASLQAQIDKARYALKVDQANLDYTRIQAPISGLIISPTSAVYGNAWSKLDIAHQGQILNNKQNAPVMFRIAKLDRMVVRSQVSEADVSKLKIGMPVYFTTLGRPDRRIDARLGAIEPTPELVNGAIFYDANFEVPNPDHSLLPQMTAQVFFVVAEAKSALVVPLAALSSTQRQSGARITGCPATASAENSDCVRVLVDGKPVARPVTAGVKNEVNAQVLDGLQAGEQVIVGTAGVPADNGSGKGNGKGGKGGGGNGGGNNAGQ